MATAAARPWYVYILRCADGSLYTGATTDLGRRHGRHEAGTASRYTRSRRPTRLVYWEAHPDRGAALRREAAIKGLPRSEKLALIPADRRNAA
jgi:predicted GIY-YIG superfamily endonuclease